MNLLTDPIPKLVRMIAIPAGTGMMFTTLFNITDTWFAGLLSTHALAALSLSFPVFFIVIAAAIGLGQGSSALIANALGQKDTDRAINLWVQASYLALAISLCIACIGLFALDAILSILSQDATLTGLTSDYLLPLLLLGFFFTAGQAANALLVAQGDSKSYRNSLIVGFFVNFLLNPLLMFGIGPFPGAGVIGIAIATVIVQAGQLAYLVHKIRVCGILGSCEFTFEFRPPLMAALTRQVLPATMTMLTVGTGLFVITHFIGRFGPEAVAAYGIGMRIEQLAMLPMIGLGAATITLIGQNLGANQMDRVFTTARYNIIAASLLMATGAVLVSIFKMPILNLFTDDPKVIDIGSRYLSVAVLIFNAYALLHVGTSIMQGLKKPMTGFAVGFTRHVMAPPLLLSLTAPAFGLGGIFWSIFAMSWGGAVLILLFVYFNARRLEPAPAMT